MSDGDVPIHAGSCMIVSTVSHPRVGCAEPREHANRERNRIERKDIVIHTESEKNEGERYGVRRIIAPSRRRNGEGLRKCDRSSGRIPWFLS